jgi:uncharacterized protein (DUF983 family)
MAAVTDPVITPFVQGMQAAGWMVETPENRRCAILGRCPKCQGSYVFSFLLDDKRLQACAHCDHSA